MSVGGAPSDSGAGGSDEQPARNNSELAATVKSVLMTVIPMTEFPGSQDTSGTPRTHCQH